MDFDQARASRGGPQRPKRPELGPNPRSARAQKSQSPSGSATLRQRLRGRRKERGVGDAGLSHVTCAPGVGSSLPKMASLLQSERVLYLVQGEKKVRAPLSQLYFCRYCSELRSLECVSHEVTGPFRGDCAPGRGCSSLSLRLAGSSAGRGGEILYLAFRLAKCPIIHPSLRFHLLVNCHLGKGRSRVGLSRSSCSRAACSWTGLPRLWGPLWDLRIETREIGRGLSSTSL